MHNRLIGGLFIILISCNPNTENKKIKSVAGTDTLASFVVIDRDSVHEISYQFKKISGQHKGLSFNYKSESDSFILFLDTSKNYYRAKFGSGVIADLDLEKTNYYTINGNNFKVLKLIGNKDVADGEFSIFLSPDFGMLVNKSNTWRTAKVICPDKSDNEYIQLSALLYKIEIDRNFFENPVPILNKKIIPPKFE